MASFFYCGRLSSAQLVPLQAPKHRPIISPRPVEQTAFRRGIKDRLYKFVPGTSTEPVVDKGIRQKSIHSFHSVHSFPDGSAFCPGAPKPCSGVPLDSEKHRRVYTSSNVCHSHEWRVDTASGLTLKKQNACLHAVRHAVGKKLRVYTASEAKVFFNNIENNNK